MKLSLLGGMMDESTIPPSNNTLISGMVDVTKQSQRTAENKFRA